MTEQPGELRPRGPRGSSSRAVVRVSLDLLDLKAIERELSELGSVVLESDQFEGRVASVDAFVAQGVRKLDHLSMVATDDRRTMLDVNMRGDGVSLFTFRPDDRKVAGVLAAVEQICQLRSRQTVTRISNLSLAFVLFAVAGLLFSTLEANFSQTARGVAVLVAFAFLILAALCWLVGRVARGGILLVRREEAPGWWRRNRDGLSVQVVGGLIVFVVGFVAGRLL